MKDLVSDVQSGQGSYGLYVIGIIWIDWKME